MKMKNFVSRVCLGLMVAALAVSASTAHADELFTSSVGYCCFTVDLHSIDSTHMDVTVSLIDGAQYFVSTGGPHVGFGFNLSGDPTISITNLSSPWTSGEIDYATASAGGYGSFNNSIDNPGSGASQHNDGPLTFEITDLSGISYNSFVANSDGYYFVADILNAQGNTGEGAINQAPPTSPVPEPSSLILLGTGIVSAAGMARRRIAKA